MLLWDIIRDWFVMYIWGGSTTEGFVYGNSIGDFLITNNGTYTDVGSDNTSFYVFIGSGTHNGLDVGEAYLSLADWLSTTSTIIVLIALCFFFFLMVRWLFRLTAGLIQGRG